MTTTAAQKLLAPAGIAMLAPDEIQPSPSNPRKTFTGIEELAEDLKVRGVLQPVLVRPLPLGKVDAPKFQLVFGERRWRAACLAQLEAIPAMVRELTDEQVLEIQLVENSKREDVHPLEEAEGYNELHTKYGYSADEIAAKVGKSRRTVYERMQLCKLVDGVKKLAFEGKLPASHLVLVARVPESLQLQAAKEIGEDDADDHAPPLSFRAAAEHIKRSYMLRLDGVPWDLTDAALLPSAGSCAKCVKRTGNQPELFADVAQKEDLCTDSVCFNKKQDALWQLKVHKAQETGQKIIDGAEAKKLFPYGSSTQMAYSAPYKKADDKVWIGDKQKTVKALLGKALETVLARAPDGAVVELVSAKLIDEKVAELAPKAKASTSGGHDSYREEERKRQEKLKLRRAVVEAAMPKIVAAVEKNGALVWRFIAETLLDGGGYHNALVDVAKRRGRAGAARADDLLRPVVAKMKEEELRGFVVEVLASYDATGGSYANDFNDSFKEACRMFARTDVKVLEAEAKAGSKKAAAVKTKSTAVCAVPGCGVAGKKQKDSPGLWCADHAKKLSSTERKSIADRAKRLASEAKAGKAARK